MWNGPGHECMLKMRESWDADCIWLRNRRVSLRSSLLPRNWMIAEWMFEWPWLWMYAENARMLGSWLRNRRVSLKGSLLKNWMNECHCSRLTILSMEIAGILHYLRPCSGPVSPLRLTCLRHRLRCLVPLFDSIEIEGIFLHPRPCSGPVSPLRLLSSCPNSIA